MSIPMQKYVFRVFPSHFRFRLIFLALVIMTALGLLLNYQSQPDVRYCFMEPNMAIEEDAVDGNGSESLQPLEDVLLAGAKPRPGKSIFFHETSCHYQRSSMNTLFGTFNNVHPKSRHLIQLNARQSCAIESAALHNPNYSIFVLFASPAYRDNSTGAARQPLVEALLSYPNVHLRNLNLWTYAAGTPIYDWLKDGELFLSRYVLSHISDFLRYLTLWRWGGTYMDMDVIVLQNMEDVPPNYTGAESNTHLAAGVMNFAADGFGHEVAEKCLQDFQHNFNGDDWGNNGPGVITRVMQEVCRTKRIEVMLDVKRCLGFKVFPRTAFYAIPWMEWEHFFEAQYLEQTLHRTQSSYVVHVWNKHSKHRRVKVGSNVAYGKLAAKHCPKVYAASGEFF